MGSAGKQSMKSDASDTLATGRKTSLMTPLKDDEKAVADIKSAIKKK